jgi:hypothetical protein
MRAEQVPPGGRGNYGRNRWPSGGGNPVSSPALSQRLLWPWASPFPASSVCTMRGSIWPSAGVRASLAFTSWFLGSWTYFSPLTLEDGCLSGIRDKSVRYGKPRCSELRTLQRYESTPLVLFGAFDILRFHLLPPLWVPLSVQTCLRQTNTGFSDTEAHHLSQTPKSYVLCVLSWGEPGLSSPQLLQNLWVISHNLHLEWALPLSVIQSAVT